MKQIRGTGNFGARRAWKVGEDYGIGIGLARELEVKGLITVTDEQAEQLIKDGLAELEPADQTTAPTNGAGVTLSHDPQNEGKQDGAPESSPPADAPATTTTADAPASEGAPTNAPENIPDPAPSSPAPDDTTPQVQAPTTESAPDSPGSASQGSDA